MRQDAEEFVFAPVYLSQRLGVNAQRFGGTSAGDVFDRQQQPCGSIGPHDGPRVQHQGSTPLFAEGDLDFQIGDGFRLTARCQESRTQISIRPYARSAIPEWTSLHVFRRGTEQRVERLIRHANPTFIVQHRQRLTNRLHDRPRVVPLLDQLLAAL